MVAVDVLRTPGWISSDDARLPERAAARSGGLWNEPGLLATRARIRALGIDDDLAYRRTVALFAKLQPGTADQLDRSRAGEPLGEAPVRADRRGAARTRMRHAGRSSRTSWASSSSRAILYASPDERSNLLTNAIGSFRTAVELDSRNDDAKVNLELALRAYGPILFPSNAPDTGGAHGQKSGQGRAGSGY